MGLGSSVPAGVATGRLAVAAAPSRRIRCWTEPPRLTVIAAPGDSCIPSLGEAIGEWNRTLAEAGTPFRLGEVAGSSG